MGVNKTANSDNTENGSEANTRSLATTLRPQIVALETSPCCIMGTCNLRNIPSATVTNTDATRLFRLLTTSYMEDICILGSLFTSVTGIVPIQMTLLSNHFST